MIPNASRLLRARVEQGHGLEQEHEAFLRAIGYSGERAQALERAGVKAVEPLLGASKPSGRVREKILRLAKSSLGVLLHGAPGTAKNVAAALIHCGSNRKGLFRQIDVASVPDGEAAELLFGRLGEHRTEGRVGLAVQCHQGSLLFSRVDLASDYFQRIALGIAEEKKRFLRRVGADVPIVAEAARLRLDWASSCDPFASADEARSMVVRSAVHDATAQLYGFLIKDLAAVFARAGQKSIAAQISRSGQDESTTAAARFLHPFDGKTRRTPTIGGSSTYDHVAQMIDDIKAKREIDVRVLSTADVSLDDRVRAGVFRGDLYDNLSSTVVRMPSLNERGRDEIAAFIGYGLRRYGLERGIRIRGLDPNYDEKLLNTDWSDNNLRGLRNEIRRAVVYLRKDGVVTDADQHEESVVKGRMGISSVHAAKRRFESMEKSARARAIADALNQTINARHPEGSKAAARRVLLKNGVKASLQTILNYLDRNHVVFDSTRRQYLPAGADADEDIHGG